MLSHGIPLKCYLSLVFSAYTHESLGASLYTEIASDAWHIPRYHTQNYILYAFVIEALV